MRFMARTAGVGVLLLGSLAAANQLARGAEKENSTPAKPSPPAKLLTVPTEATLPIGSRCTVQTSRGGQQLTHVGKIARVSPEWLVLESVEAPATMTGVPVLNKVPYKSRLFKAEFQTVSQETSEIWIPRDTILCVSITPQSNKAAARPALLCEVQTKTAKNVSVLRDSFVVHTSATDSRANRKGSHVPGVDVALLEKPRDTSAAKHTIAVSSDAIYKITVQSSQEKSAGASKTYYGKVIALDGDFLVLAPIVIEGRSQASIPLLSKLPYLSRYFKNSGVGLEDADQPEVRVSLQNVVRMQLCDESDIPRLQKTSVRNLPE